MGALLVLLSLASLAALSSAGTAGCPTSITPVASLSSTAFSGFWYEVAKSARLRFESPDVMPTKCNSMQFRARKPSKGKPQQYDVIMSGNNSLQYMPWAYGRTDVFVAMAQYNRAVCKSLALLPGALKTTKLPADLASLDSTVGTICLQSSLISQGQLSGTNLYTLSSYITAAAANLTKISAAGSTKYKSNKSASNIFKIISAAATNLTKAANLTGYVDVVQAGYRGGNDHAGLAKQSSTKGQFQVDFKSLNYKRDYTVVAVRGTASNYTSAVLYSCYTSGGAPREDVIVLSRERTLNVKVYNDYMTLLQGFGVTLTCDNPMVPTFQDKGADCKRG